MQGEDVFIPAIAAGKDGALIESEFRRPLSTMKRERIGYRRVFKDLRESGEWNGNSEHPGSPPPVGKACRDGELTSQIAHELNNPIYGIMNTLELLKSEVRPRAKGGHSRAVAFRDGEAHRDAAEHAQLFQPEEEKRCR